MKPLVGLWLGAAVFVGCLATSPLIAGDNEARIAAGKKIAFDRKKGNCLGCHMLDNGSQPGNPGPPLIAMKARFPEKAKLRAQLWDSTAVNPSSFMPPFGRHRILTEGEIDLVTDYIYSL